MHDAPGPDPGSPETAPPLAVLVVDDQPAVREGVARLLACAPFALRGVGVAGGRDEALRVAGTLHPDVVVLDADLAGDDGLELIPQFARGTAVLVLSCHGDAATRLRASRLGAHAFIEKHQPAADLLRAIAALAGARERGEKTPTRPGEMSRPPAVASSAAPARTRS